MEPISFCPLYSSVAVLEKKDSISVDLAYQRVIKIQQKVSVSVGARGFLIKDRSGERN